MAVRHYITILKRRKWVAAVVGVVVFACVFGFALQQGPSFAATAEALINRQEMDLSNSLAGSPTDLAASQDNGRLALTQAGIATSPAVAEATIRTLGLRDTAPADLQSRIAVNGSATSDLLTFTATATTSNSAVRLVNSYVHEYLAYVDELNTEALRQARASVQALLAQAKSSHAASRLITNLRSRVQQLTITQALQAGDIELVSGASTATKVRPKPLEDAVIGIILGIVLGLAVALAWDGLDTRPRNAEEVTSLLEVPLLGRVAPFPRVHGSVDQLPASRVAGPAAEDFRLLRAALELASIDYPMRSVLLTSAVQGEGKTTTAANLAITIARAGQTVALVDLDLHRPRLATLFGSEDTRGITKVAAGRSSLEDEMTHFRIDHGGLSQVTTEEARSSSRSLAVLCSGPLPPDPAEFVGSRAVATLFGELRGLYDVILIDSPPLLSVSDPVALSKLVDGVLIVARSDRVKRPQLREARRLLGLLSARPLGVVLNADGERLSYSDYEYYGSEAAAARLAASDPKQPSATVTSEE